MTTSSKGDLEQRSGAVDAPSRARARAGGWFTRVLLGCFFVASIWYGAASLVWRPQRRMNHVPIAAMEAEWGALIGLAKVETHASPTLLHVGLFQHRDGTLWGLVLAAPDTNAALAECVPADLHVAPITDSLRRDVVAILGASGAFSNPGPTAPVIQLLVRDSLGTVRWARLAGGQFAGATAMCRGLGGVLHHTTQERYHYFRIAGFRGVSR